MTPGLSKRDTCPICGGSLSMHLPQHIEEECPEMEWNDDGDESFGPPRRQATLGEVLRK